MKHKEIVFFYPSKIVGGAEMLFMRLAKFLCSSTNYKISYVDFKDGFAYKAFKDNTRIHFYEFNYRQIKLADDAVLVAPLSSAFDMISFFSKGNYNVMFWSLHPEGLKNAIRDYQRIRIRKVLPSCFGKAIQRFLDDRGLLFMDAPNYHLQMRYFQLNNSVDLSYMPIFCEKKQIIKVYDPIKEIISFGWLGRLSNDKIFSILNVLQQCNHFLSSNPDHNIDFHIIGEGNEEWRIDSFETHPNLKVIRKKTIIDEDLFDYLRSNVEVLFAMGTSSLEGASLGIATILLDFSNSDMSENCTFRWLYEANEFSVGDKYDPLIHYSHQIEEIVMLVKKGKIGEVGQKCLLYFVEKHSLESTASKFLKSVERNKLTYIKVEETIFGSFTIMRMLKKVKAIIKEL